MPWQVSRAGKIAVDGTIVADAEIAVGGRIVRKVGGIVLRRAVAGRKASPQVPRQRLSHLFCRVSRFRSIGVVMMAPRHRVHRLLRLPTSLL
jgi:hypothetical protein